MASAFPSDGAIEMMSFIEILRDIGFLHGIDDELLERIDSVGEIVDFKAGSVIFREGDVAENIYLITEGNISLEICAPSVGCRRILTVGQGELLGWSPVLEQSRLTATARSLGPSQAVRISGRQMLALCEHDPKFGYEFMRRAALALAKRLSAARLQLLDVYGAEAPAETQTSNN